MLVLPHRASPVFLRLFLVGFLEQLLLPSHFWCKARPVFALVAGVDSWSSSAGGSWSQVCSAQPACLFITFLCWLQCAAASAIFRHAKSR